MSSSSVSQASLDILPINLIRETIKPSAGTIEVIKPEDVKDRKWQTVLKIVGLVGLIGVSYLAFQFLSSNSPNSMHVGNNGTTPCDAYGPIPFDCIKPNNSSIKLNNFTVNSFGNFSEGSPLLLKSFEPSPSTPIKVAETLIDAQTPGDESSKIKKMLLSKTEQTEEYLSFIENLNPNVMADAKKMLAWENPFNEQEYEADKEKYVKRLCRKLSLYIHPDKCSTKECEAAFLKMKQAAEYLLSSQTEISIQDFFKDFNPFYDPQVHDMPVYSFHDKSVEENIDLSNLDVEKFIKKPVQWKESVGKFPKHLEEVIDWISSPDRQRFEFEYSLNGWNRKLNAPFDFKRDDQKTTKLGDRCGSSSSYFMGKAQAYISFPVIDGKMEKALLSIVDGNLVLWQQNSSGHKTITVSTHSLEEFSAFNLFKDYEYIKFHGNEVLIPVKMLK